MDDPQIAELKQLMRQNIALAEETNKMLRHMRSAARLKSLMWLLLVLISLGLSYWSYATYIEPRVSQIENFYTTNVAPLQGATSGIGAFFNSFKPASSTTPQN